MQVKRDAVSELGAKLQQYQTKLTEVIASIEALEKERNDLIKSAMDSASAKVQLKSPNLRAR